MLVGGFTDGNAGSVFSFGGSDMATEISETRGLASSTGFEVAAACAAFRGLRARSLVS
jgi:hypothetical protein